MLAVVTTTGTQAGRPLHTPPAYTSHGRPGSRAGQAGTRIRATGPSAGPQSTAARPAHWGATATSTAAPARTNSPNLVNHRADGSSPPWSDASRSCSSGRATSPPITR
ncbi:hypothetical protein ACFQX7_03835 [Luedemannella flava]